MKERTERFLHLLLLVEGRSIVLSGRTLWPVTDSMCLVSQLLSERMVTEVALRQ